MKTSFLVTLLLGSFGCSQGNEHKSQDGGNVMTPKASDPNTSDVTRQDVKAQVISLDGTFLGTKYDSKKIIVTDSPREKDQLEIKVMDYLPVKSDRYPCWDLQEESEQLSSTFDISIPAKTGKSTVDSVDFVRIDKNSDTGPENYYGGAEVEVTKLTDTEIAVNLSANFDGVDSKISISGSFDVERCDKVYTAVE